MDPQDRRTPEQIERDALQNKYAHNYLLIPMPVMMNPELTLADKAVFGRAYGFDFLFESPTQTAAVLGISPSQVRVSKRKLEKMGLLTCVEENFFGKKYVARLANYTYPLSKSDNPPIKICQPPCQNLTTENKERLNGEERLSSKDKSFEEAQAPAEDSEKDPLNEDKPKSYGKAEINDLLELWREETGFDHKSTKSERYAINNLLRKNGYEDTKALIRRVGRARRSDNQFAPQIAKPSQLQGKYSKLEALVLWEERQSQAEQPKTATGRPIIEGPKVPVFKPDKDVRDDKTEEELRAECQAIRDKYKGTKFEHIFNGGRK